MPKFMNNRYYEKLNLQVFADDDSTDAGDGDDRDDDQNDDSDEGGDESEKKFSQKEVDEVVKQRLARERRKWQREQKTRRPDSGDTAGKSGDNEEEDESEALRLEREKSSYLELKWACLEHDVRIDCVDDVLALAKVYAGKEKDLDIEDAIDKVLEKYSHFKNNTNNESDEELEQLSKKGWGQRHEKGSKSKKTLDDELSEQLFGRK